jgi:hypothetical protein
MVTRALAAEVRHAPEQFAQLPLSPWARSRGMSRLLAQETNISDLLQFLSDRDSGPWADLVGFAPTTVERESREASHADLLLISDDRRAAVEVKLGHLMDDRQQARYEDLASDTDLYLAALNMDRRRLDSDSTNRWNFLNLEQIFEAWTEVDDEVSRVLARQTVLVLRAWNSKISAVFESPDSDDAKPLSSLAEKFLARVVTRRIGSDLRDRGRLARAGVTSGGGLPLVQAWTPIRNEGTDRCFIAEARWWENKPGGELRFGVDFEPRPDMAEDEEVRRAAHELSCSMDSLIDFVALRGHLEVKDPRLAGLLDREKDSRPVAKGDWEQVIRHGFAGARLSNGKKNNRVQTRPAFYGDGALRFQAIANINFESAGARDITNLLDRTLTYLAEGQPI